MFLNFQIYKIAFLGVIPLLKEKKASIRLLLAYNLKPHTMNYIRHLNLWFEVIAANHEAKPTHIALYVALFQLWNTHRFSDDFCINRHEMTQLSKLGSNTTYSKCMRDLHRWGWIRYTPSNSKYGVSKVSLYRWTEQGVQSASAALMPKKQTLSSSNPVPIKSSSGGGTATSTATSSTPSLATTSEQEVGHSLKQVNKEEQTTKYKAINSLKSKFHEPL